AGGGPDRLSPLLQTLDHVARTQCLPAFGALSALFQRGARRFLDRDRDPCRGSPLLMRYGLRGARQWPTTWRPSGRGRGGGATGKTNGASSVDARSYTRGLKKITSPCACHQSTQRQQSNSG